MPDKTGVMRSPPNKLGKFEIRKLLGKGNMGMVFLAHDPVLERDVAIKVMAGSSINDAEMRERFEREAKAVARLHHPNIVTIHDLGYDHQGSPFIAMELLEGTDLEHLLEINPPSVIPRLEIVAQVCRGLHHAHSAGIVHRDVKPANIFVTQDGAKIMDFGVARWMKSSQTQSGMVLGTASYMSPEQIRGERVDGRSDIFSVGIVLYQLLTDKKLFSGESIETVFFKTLTEDPPELVMPDGRGLPELQAIVSSALAKDVEDRYSSAEKMAKAIETFLRAHSQALPEKPVFSALDPGSALRPSGGKGSLRQLSHGATRPGATDAAGVPVQESAPLTPVGATQPAPSKVIPATEVRPAPVRPPTRSHSRIRPTRVRPPAPSRLPRVAAAVVLLGAAAGAYLFVFHQPDSSPPPASALGSSPAPVDLEKRFQFAEGLLENGQIAQAFEAVQNILAIEPRNPRALELQEAVRKAAQDQAKPEPAQTSPPVEKPGPVPSHEPTPREQAATIAADAALALSNGQLEEAQSLIARGRRLNPQSPRWSELSDQLRAKQAEAELKSFAAQYVQQGRLSLEGGNYQGAIDAYKKAMEYEPENREAQNGLDRTISLKHQAEAEQQAAVPERRFVESKTVFTPSQSDTQEVVGFEMEDRFKVNETADPFFPAQIIIELNPTDAKPGEPYVLRVRVFNEGYRPIDVRSLELVSRFSGKTTGKGAQIPTRIQRIDPQATALVHEIAGTWKESQHHGEIAATVTLADGGTFSKSISW